MRNLTVSGDAYVYGNQYVGIIAGQNSGKVTNCSVSGEARGKANRIGGVVGINYGAVTDCTADAYVFGSGSIGGIVGTNNGTVANCRTANEIKANMTGGKAGGIVGTNNGDVINCLAACTRVEGSSSTGGSGECNTGGIVGYNKEGTVSNCTASCDEVVNHAGGVIGWNVGTLMNSVSTCASVDMDGGGVIGWNSSGRTGTNCGWLTGAHVPSSRGNDGGTYTDVISYDVNSADQVAVTCLPENISLSLESGESKTVALQTYPAPNKLDHISGNVTLKVTPGIATAEYDSTTGVITVTAGKTGGTGVVSMSVTFKPTHFSGDLKGTSTDVHLTSRIALTVKSEQPEPPKPPVNPFTPVDPKIADKDKPEEVRNTIVTPITDINLAAAATGMDAKNLRKDAEYVVPNDEFIKKAANDALRHDTDIEFVSAEAVPIASTDIETGKVSTFAFDVKGDKLFCDKLANLKVVKMFADGTGELFKIAATSADFTDQHVTILKSGDVYADAIVSTDSYTLCAFVKDGGRFDLDGEKNGKVVDPIAIVETKEKSRNSSGGCNAGFAVLALLALAPTVLAKKKR